MVTRADPLSLATFLFFFNTTFFCCSLWHKIHSLALQRKAQVLYYEQWTLRRWLPVASFYHPPPPRGEEEESRDGSCANASYSCSWLTATLDWGVWRTEFCIADRGGLCVYVIDAWLTHKLYIWWRQPQYCHRLVCCCLHSPRPKSKNCITELFPVYVSMHKCIMFIA